MDEFLSFWEQLWSKTSNWRKCIVEHPLSYLIVDDDRHIICDVERLLNSYFDDLFDTD